MPRSTVRLLTIVFFGILAAWLSAGCQPTPDASPTMVPILPTAVPASPSPVPPTPTPTAVPLTDARAILISASQDFFLSMTEPTKIELGGYTQYIKELVESDGSRSTHIRWWGAGNGELNLTITIAQQPWENIPETKYLGHSYFDNSKWIAQEFPIVGQSSQAYTFDEGGWSRFTFIRGDALVHIYGRDFTPEQLVDLGTRIEAQLPNSFSELAPIAFPDQLDPALFSTYFSEITLGNMKQDIGIVPITETTQLAQFWSYVIVPDAPINWEQRSIVSPVWETAVYAVDSGQIVYKITAIWSTDAWDRQYPLIFPPQSLTVGAYEFRLAIKGVLIVAMPFTIP